MKKFSNDNLNKVISMERKHNLFNWITPKAGFWMKKIAFLVFEVISISFVVFTLVFLLFNIIPGEPREISDFTGKGLTQEQYDAALNELYIKYHLDGGLFNQYIWALRGFFDGTMGISWSTQVPIIENFFGRLGISSLIGFTSILLSLGIGIPTGIYLARRETKFSDFVASILSVIAFSIPSFVFALVAVFINYSVGLPFVFDYGNVFMILLPALMIAIPAGFGYTRYLRTSIRAEYKEQYVSLARIKGLSENKILTRHILKPALFPIINYLPFLVVAAFFGSITIESVFSIPGTGNMLINAALEHDQPVMLAITVFYTIFMVLSFFVRDLLIAFVDPRIGGE